MAKLSLLLKDSLYGTRPLYTVRREAEWCSSDGKQYGSS